MQSAELIVETRTLPIEEQAASTDLFDSIALRAELKWLDEVDHPWGPFATYERHLEYILSQYEITAPESFTVHAPRIHTQKESLI